MTDVKQPTGGAFSQGLKLSRSLSGVEADNGLRLRSASGLSYQKELNLTALGWGNF